MHDKLWVTDGDDSAGDRALVVAQCHGVGDDACGKVCVTGAGDKPLVMVQVTLCDEVWVTGCT